MNYEENYPSEQLHWRDDDTFEPSLLTDEEPMSLDAVPPENNFTTLKLADTALKAHLREQESHRRHRKDNHEHKLSNAPSYVRPKTNRELDVHPQAPTVRQILDHEKMENDSISEWENLDVSESGVDEYETMSSMRDWTDTFNRLNEEEKQIRDAWGWGNKERKDLREKLDEFYRKKGRIALNFMHKMNRGLIDRDMDILIRYVEDGRFGDELYRNKVEMSYVNENGAESTFAILPWDITVHNDAASEEVYDFMSQHINSRVEIDFRGNKKETALMEAGDSIFPWKRESYRHPSGIDQKSASRLRNMADDIHGHADTYRGEIDRLSGHYTEFSFLPERAFREASQLEAQLKSDAGKIEMSDLRRYDMNIAEAKRLETWFGNYAPRIMSINNTADLSIIKNMGAELTKLGYDSYDYEALAAILADLSGHYDGSQPIDGQLYAQYKAKVGDYDSREDFDYHSSLYSTFIKSLHFSETDFDDIVANAGENEEYIIGDFSVNPHLTNAQVKKLTTKILENGYRHFSSKVFEQLSDDDVRDIFNSSIDGRRLVLECFRDIPEDLFLDSEFEGGSSFEWSKDQNALWRALQHNTNLTQNTAKELLKRMLNKDDKVWGDLDPTVLIPQENLSSEDILAILDATGCREGSLYWYMRRPDKDIEITRKLESGLGEEERALLVKEILDGKLEADADILHKLAFMSGISSENKIRLMQHPQYVESISEAALSGEVEPLSITYQDQIIKYAPADFNKVRTFYVNGIPVLKEYGAEFSDNTSIKQFDRFCRQYGDAVFVMAANGENYYDFRDHFQIRAKMLQQRIAEARAKRS